MKKVLQKAETIRKISVIGTILGVVLLTCAILLIIAYNIIVTKINYFPPIPRPHPPHPSHPLINYFSLISRSHPYYINPDSTLRIVAGIINILFIIFILGFVSINTIFAVLLIVNSCWIYLSNEIKENEETKFIVSSYKLTIMILSILTLFFSIVFLITIWIISSNKITFLKEKIDKIKKSKNLQKE